jgi:hypothetical protein
MDTLKSILIFIGKLLANLLFLAAAYFIYIKMVRPITAHTVAPDHFQEIIGILLLMTLWPLLNTKPFQLIKPISFGLVCLFIPVFIYALYFVNEVGSPGSYQRSFPIESKERVENELVVGAYVYEKSGRVHYKIPADDCIRLDSLKIVIKEGLLGMKIVTDDIHLLKRANCGS